MSLAASLARQGEALNPGHCDECGATYLAPRRRVFVMSVRSPALDLDLGGYCPGCRRDLCPRHLGYDHVRADYLPDPDSVRNISYGLVCRRCGTPVQAARDADPTASVTILTIDAKDLEPKRPQPAAEFAAPSGKFSLLKVVESHVKAADPELAAIPRMICETCLAFHPHPVPAPVLGFDAFKASGYEFGPEDFEVDIGGTCPTCGVLCSKHIELRKTTHDGKPVLALFCTTHHERLV